MSGNTLISIKMMLMMAMRDVRRATSVGDEPFEIRAEFLYPSAALIMMLDQFDAEYIGPSIADAMAAKRPLGEEVEFPLATHHADTETTAGGEAYGIAGRIVRYYDISTDRHPTRIEIRVLRPDVLLASD